MCCKFNGSELKIVPSSRKVCMIPGSRLHNVVLPKGFEFSHIEASNTAPVILELNMASQR
jgi:hypothetical protein